MNRRSLRRVGHGPRFWPLAALLVVLGAFLAPAGVPLYDGVGLPDEPYRYAAPPAGVTSPVAAPASLATEVVGGVSTAGLTVQTIEMAPQFQLFVPLGAVSGTDGTATVTATPTAATDQPPGATVDGNVYTVTVTNAAGPVALNDKVVQSALIMRATSGRLPRPTMYHRAAPGQPWAPLTTNPVGLDVYASPFPGLGQYALAFADGAKGGGVPVLVVVLAGLVVVLVGVVLVVRRRA